MYGEQDLVLTIVNTPGSFITISEVRHWHKADIHFTLYQSQGSLKGIARIAAQGNKWLSFTGACQAIFVQGRAHLI